MRCTISSEPFDKGLVLIENFNLVLISSKYLYFSRISNLAVAGR